jgi:hypothetical protein
MNDTRTLAAGSAAILLLTIAPSVSTAQNQGVYVEVVADRRRAVDQGQQGNGHH